MQAVPAQVQEFLRSVTSTEGRLAVTGAVIIVAFLVAVLLAPRAVRWLSRTFRVRMRESEGWELLRRLGRGVPASLTVLLLRALQVGTLAVAGFAVLLVWGRVAWALAILRNIGEAQDLILNLAVTLVIVILTYAGLDVLSDTVDRFGEEVDRITEHQEEIVRRLGQLCIIAIAIATGLTLWGIDLSGLLVGAGFIGIVVGFAARQTLGSLIAGLVLMFSRPFTIGDWVVIGGQEGIVTDITIVNTRLENFDGEFLIIPNDRVANEAITNRSRKGHYRIRLEVGVDYATDPDRARDVALEAMDDLDAIEPAPPPQAILTEFGDSAVLIELRFWIDRPTPPRMWQATNAVVEAVHEAFDREGIKIPFPQRELSGRAETGGFRVLSGDLPESPPSERRAAADRDGED
ncbi:MAG: mechanosensitive ion channel family protein [Salinirussus sp.]